MINSDESNSSTILFAIGEELFFVFLTSIQEIVDIQSFCSIQFTPDIEGIINYRNSVIPSLSITHEPLQSRVISANSKALIFSYPSPIPQGFFAILADSVRGIIDISQEQLILPSKKESLREYRFSMGVLIHNHEEYVGISVEHLLNSVVERIETYVQW